MENYAQEMPKQEAMLDFYQKLRLKINKAVASKSLNGVGKEKGAYSQLVSYLTALPDLFHLGVKLLFDGSVPSENKGALVAALVYVVSPIDIIPDSVPIAGWVDDLVVMAMAINKFLDTDEPAINSAVSRHWAGERNFFETIKHIIDIVDEAAEFLPKKLMKLVKDLFPKPLNK